METRNIRRLNQDESPVGRYVAGRACIVLLTVRKVNIDGDRRGVIEHRSTRENVVNCAIQWDRYFLITRSRNRAPRTRARAAIIQGGNHLLGGVSLHPFRARVDVRTR